MAEEKTPPPRITLGDYAMQQGPRHFSSIAIPATTRALDHEDPYSHLSTFYELVGTMGSQSGDLENVYVFIFFFH